MTATSPHTVLEVVREYGPAVASVVGSVLTILLGIIAWLGRTAWNQHEERVKKALGLIEKVPEWLKASEEKAAKDHGHLKEKIQELRAELALHIRSSDQLKQGMFKLEGVTDQQQKTLHEHIKQLIGVDAKLEALFRVIDSVPRRASDVPRKS